MDVDDSTIGPYSEADSMLGTSETGSIKVGASIAAFGREGSLKMLGLTSHLRYRLVSQSSRTVFEPVYRIVV